MEEDFLTQLGDSRITLLHRNKCSPLFKMRHPHPLPTNSGECFGYTDVKWNVRQHVVTGTEFPRMATTGNCTRLVGQVLWGTGQPGSVWNADRWDRPPASVTKLAFHLLVSFCVFVYTMDGKLRPAKIIQSGMPRY
jgi:hypothetical protein